MRAACCNIFGYAIACVMLFMGQCVSHSLIYRSHTISTSSSLSGVSLHDNYVGFDSVPDQVIDGSVVHVHYLCSRPCKLTMEVVVPSPPKPEAVVFRRKWTSHRPVPIPRVQAVELRYPASIVYKQDLFNRHTLDPRNVTLRAWLDLLDDEPGTYQESTVKTYKVLRSLPPSQRPAKPRTECLSWSVELMWRLTRVRILQCAHESDTVNMLKFPLASTGELSGVVRRIRPFINPDLERARVQAITKPSITMSVWVYLVEWCDNKLCGIIHHVDRNNAYDSPLIQLTDTGDIVFQVRLTGGEDEAFRAILALPLQTWIRLDCFIQFSKVTLETTWDKTTLIHTYKFRRNINWDDSNGYFVVGGSKYVPGIHGYFGTIKYYRFGTEKVRNSLFMEKTLEYLDKTHQECEETKGFTTAFLRGMMKSHLRLDKGLCRPHYIQLWRMYKQGFCEQRWTWKTQQRHSALLSFLQSQEKGFRTESWGVNTRRNLGQQLFEHAVAVFNEYGGERRFNSTLVDLLKTSSCFSYHRASLLLASIYLTGLGESIDQQKGHVYSLIGALGDDRLALMHVGYKHTRGLDGFPKDVDMAYAYYANVGAQCVIDSERVMENQQQPTEHIHLSNKEDINNLVHETGDYFQFLKHQAERGDIESQKLLARILFWGQNGVSKNVTSALKWFERSAMQMQDPAAMYDYAILLLKGHGVKKNRSLGLRLLDKAATMGLPRALNGLGWYHATQLKDHKTALKYFEKAACNGSNDGMFNRGLYQLNGKHPDQPHINETAAFQHFLNASRLGHVNAAVEVARYLATGNLKGVTQDAEKAVVVLKRVCDLNGHLGYLIKEALQAYLRGSRAEALIKYVMAAEAGLGVAQNNAAHLYEELKLSDSLMWRYYNHSTMNYDPHPSGLLKMGDHYYYSSSRQRDSLPLVGQAVSMYSRAAVAGSPQGMYNLVLLAQEGHVLPLTTRRLFNVSPHDDLDILVEKILNRCVEFEDAEAVTPCSLALLRVQMGKAWSQMTQNCAQLSLVYVCLLSFIFTGIIMSMQICLEHLSINNGQRNSNHRAAEMRIGAFTVNQAGVSWNVLHDDIMRQEVPTRTLQMAKALWLTILSGIHRLLQTRDLAVTVSGVCLCAVCTTLLCHLL